MLNHGPLISPEHYQYLIKYSLQESSVLEELRKKTADMPEGHMQIAPDQGQFMAFLIKLIGAKRVLEFGTFTGYSSLVMAQALPDDGELITLDTDKNVTDIAQQFWQRAGLSHKIKLILGRALESLEQIEGPFDLAFIDADKHNYKIYFDASLKLLRKNGLILIDNTFMRGRVFDAGDKLGQAIHAFNEYIYADKRVEIVMLPINDGLTVARKL